VYPRQILKFVHRRLPLRYTKLMFKLARSSHTYTPSVLGLLFSLKIVQWVRATGVGPHVWECDLFRRTLLEQKLAIRWAEDKRRKGAVEETLIDVLHEVA
jgi:hypothetical protein